MIEIDWTVTIIFTSLILTICFGIFAVFYEDYGQSEMETCLEKCSQIASVRENSGYKYTDQPIQIACSESCMKYCGEA